MATFPVEHGEELRIWVKERVSDFDWRAIEKPDARRAAVSIALVPDEDGRACFILTRRGLGLRNHRGQFALPGGKLEPGEEAGHAALRELAEEVGLVLGEASILGRLDDFATRSGFVISPFLVWCDEWRDLVPDPHEVSRLYRVPLGDLEHPDAPIITKIPQSDKPVLSMPVLGMQVHAPTAAFIYQLLEVALRGRATRVAHFEQPVFAWR